MGTTITNQDPWYAKSREDDPLKEPRDHPYIVNKPSICLYPLKNIVNDHQDVSVSP